MNHQPGLYPQLPLTPPSPHREGDGERESWATVLMGCAVTAAAALRLQREMAGDVAGGGGYGEGWRHGAAMIGCVGAAGVEVAA